MVDRRSPLERMIDEACGVTPQTTFGPSILLQCPICIQKKFVPLHRNDPPGAVRLEFPCIPCGTKKYGSLAAFKASDEEVHYFDNKGREIDLDGKVL